MRRRPSIRGLRPSLPAWLALAAWSLALLTGSPARADKGSRDIVVRLAGVLVEQGEKRPVVRLDVTLPLHEWVNREGGVEIEPQPGAGKALIERAGGGRQEVAFSARLTRFIGPPRTLPDGRLSWSLRGELYLVAEGRDTLEAEIGPAVIVPPVGEKYTYSVPERWPEGPEVHAEIGRSVEALLGEGRGGFVTTGPTFWERPASHLPQLGVLMVVEVESKPAKKGSVGREADRLINRIQYVAGDYARSVKDGQVVNQLEYSEQVRLLQEAAVLADELGVTDKARALLFDLRRQVDWRLPAAEVASSCKELEAELLSTIGLLLGSPVPSGVAEAAPLFREHCAKCHGESGDGRGPSAKEIDPPPRSFLDPADRAGMTPHRAFMAITSGVPGTAMASFEDAIGLEQRWALAFYALSLRNAGAGMPADLGQTSFSLDDLATSTDERLAAMAAQAGAGARSGEVAAYWRSAAAVERAARSPFEPIRRDLRAAVSGEGEEAILALDRAREALSSLVPEIRSRDEAAAGEALSAVAAVREALVQGAGAGEVRRAAWRAFPALRKAEIALDLSPRARSGAGGSWVSGVGALLAILVGIALWKVRDRAVPPMSRESRSGSPS